MGLNRVRFSGTIIGLLRFCTDVFKLALVHVHSRLDAFNTTSPYNQRQQFKDCCPGKDTPLREVVESAHKYIIESCVFPWETL